MARELKPCGTKAAYERHRRHGDDVTTLTCGCREANAAYSEAYGLMGRNKARQRALQALAARYRDEFNRLYVAELNRVEESR